MFWTFEKYLDIDMNVNPFYTEKSPQKLPQTSPTKIRPIHRVKGFRMILNESFDNEISKKPNVLF